MIIKQFEKFKINEGKVQLDKTIKNIVDMVETNSYFKTEYIDEESEEINFVTCENGDIVNKKHSSADIDEARRVVKIIGNNFNNVNVNIKPKGECVVINVSLKNKIEDND